MRIEIILDRVDNLGHFEATALTVPQLSYVDMSPKRALKKLVKMLDEEGLLSAEY